MGLFRTITRHKGYIHYVENIHENLSIITLSGLTKEDKSKEIYFYREIDIGMVGSFVDIVETEKGLTTKILDQKIFGGYPKKT